MLLRTVSLTAIALTSLACANTTLDLKTGDSVAGEIERADAQHVYIVLEEPRSAREAHERAAFAEARLTPDGKRGEGRRLFRIRHDAIEDMSFPGRGAGITGTVLATVGLGTALSGFILIADCSGGFCGIIHIFTTIPGGIVFAGGVATMIPGWVIYADAAETAQPEHTVHLQPFASPTEGGAGGLAATATW